MTSRTRSAFKSNLPADSVCVVCTQPAHGYHFGVVSCRACAAFFRRTVVFEKEYKCRRLDGKCEILSDVRLSCRHCRYKKCQTMGMIPDNVQFNRGTVAKTEKEEKGKAPKERRQSLPEELEEPYEPNCSNTALLNEQTPSTSTESLECAANNTLIPNTLTKNGIQKTGSSSKRIIDMSPASTSVENIFKNFQPKLDDCTQFNALQRMVVALRYFRRNQCRNPTLLEQYEVEAYQYLWQEELELVAEWLMHCAEFTQLPMDEKKKLFRSSWYIFQRLEQLQASIEIFGEDVFTDQKMLLYQRYAVYCKETKFDAKYVSDYDGEHIKKMMSPLMDRFINNIGLPLRALQLTETELTYMLCQLVWHVEDRDVSEEIVRVADLYRERISNELHDYYIHTLQMPNYAGRLIQIMDLNRQMEILQNDRCDVMEMIHLFDIFKIEFESDVVDYRNY